MDDSPSTRPPATLWIVRTALGLIPAQPGDVLVTHEDGGARVYQRDKQGWEPSSDHEIGLPVIGAWSALTAITPATPEDGDRFRVQQLLAEMEGAS